MLRSGAQPPAASARHKHNLHSLALSCHAGRVATLRSGWSRTYMLSTCRMCFGDLSDSAL